MLPQIKQRLKQSSVPRESNQSQHQPANALLEKYLEMQREFLVRADQNNAKLTGALSQLATAVGSIQLSLTQIHTESMESYANISSLLGKVIKLQSSAIKAERTMVSELQELNKERKANTIADESIVIGRQASVANQHSPFQLKTEREEPAGLPRQLEEEPKVDILGESNVPAIRNDKNSLLGENARVQDGEKQETLHEKLRRIESQPAEAKQPPSTPTTLSPMSAFTAQAGEFRDRELIFPLGESIEGISLVGNEPFEQIRVYLRKWIGKCLDIITKEAFAGYYSKAMLESQTKVFLCKHIILNFHKMMEFFREHYPQEWSSHSSDIITLFQKESTNAFGYYLSKYPQKKNVFISSDVEHLIPEMNELNKPENSILGRLGVYFRANNGDYTSSIKLMLNAIVKEAQQHLRSFRQFMKEVFTIQDADGQPYQIDNLIGMKFRENMPTYSDGQVTKLGIDIKSPEVLRVLIKWTEELEEMANNPRKVLVEKPSLILNRHGKPIDPGRMFREQLSNHIEGSKDSYLDQEFISNILDSTYCDLAEYVKMHRADFDYLPRSTLETGMTVHILSEVSSRVAVLYLDRLIGFFNEMVAQAHVNQVYESRHNFKLEDAEFIPFTVCDLLRAKCSGGPAEVRQVLNNLRAANAKIVRVKNRLNSSNRDFLINFFFGDVCRVVCEVQVGLKDSTDDKQMFLDHYNHFLYELCRSKYGVLSESALIIGNITEMGSYFANKIKALPTMHRDSKLDLKLKVSSQGITLVGYTREQNNFSFLCSNCMQLRKAYETEESPWRKDKFLVCAKCVYSNLSKKDRALLLIGDVGLFFEEADKLTEKDVYFCTVSDDADRTTDYYSMRYLEQNFIGIDSYDPYYLTFSNGSHFYGRSAFKNKKLFRLRENVALVTLRLDIELSEDMSRAPPTVSLKKAAVNPEELRGIQDVDKPRHIGAGISDSLSESPTRFGLVRCVVHPEHSIVMVLDYQFEEEASGEIKKRHLRFSQQKKLQKMVDSAETQWILANQDFDQQSFKNFPSNDTLEWLYLDRGLFTRLDFFRSKSLTKLHIPLCKIVDMSMPGNFPELVEIDLMKNKVRKIEGINSCRKLKKLEIDQNEVQVLDLTILDLPCLELLNVTSNKIEKIVVNDGCGTRLPRLREINLNSNPLKEFVLEAALPTLASLNIGLCQLSRFAATSECLPSLSELAISGNRQLSKLDLRSFNMLNTVEAQRCDLQQVQLATINSYLEKIDLSSNKLTFERFELGSLGASALKEADLSANHLKHVVVNGNWNKLQSLRLSNNRMEQIEFVREVESAKDIVHAEDCELALLNLNHNLLKKVDLRPLGRMTWLKRIELEFNLLGEVLFSEQEECLYVFTLKLAYNPRPFSSRTWTLQNFISLKELSMGVDAGSGEYCQWRISCMTPQELSELSANIEQQRKKDPSIPEHLMEDAISKEKFLDEHINSIKNNATVLKLLEVFKKIESSDRNDHQRNAIEKSSHGSGKSAMVVLAAHTDI